MPADSLPFEYSPEIQEPTLPPAILDTVHPFSGYPTRIHVYKGARLEEIFQRLKEMRGLGTVSFLQIFLCCEKGCGTRLSRVSP